MAAKDGKYLTIGVTGGIGSGKSVVTTMLAKHGIEVIDADLIARIVVEPGSTALNKIAEHFGRHFIRSDGTLDRAALRARVFQDHSERKWLENLLHPLIRAEITAQLAASKSPYSVLSSPLLFETGQDVLVDKVLLIDACERLQIDRTKERDNIDTNAVAAIMASQWPRSKRIEKADFIIVNDGTLNELEVAVADMHKQFLALAEVKTTNQKHY